MKQHRILLDPDPANNPPAGGAPAPAAPAPAAPAPAAPPAAPAGFVTEAQMKAQIDKARSEERTKLHDQLTTATTEVTGLKTKISELDSQLKALGSVKTANGQIDVQALIAQVTESAKTATATANAQLQRELDEMRAQNHRLELERVRQKAIADGGGENAMVVALVTGNSESEIRASVEEAKRTQAQIIERAKSSQSHGAPAPAPALPPSPPAPAAPASAPSEVSGMTVREWGQNRDKQLAALKLQYS